MRIARNNLTRLWDSLRFGPEALLTPVDSLKKDTEGF
jgi:hypothetical protein